MSSSLDSRPLLAEEGKYADEESQDSKMEGAGEKKGNPAPLLCEVFGTAVLTATAGFTSNNPDMSPVEGALTVAAVLVALVYSLGHVSGCHINPAVTLFMLLARKIAPLQACLYVISQVCGALFGGQITNWVTNNSTIPPSVQSAGATWILELTFTFLLVIVVIHTASTFTVNTGSAIGAIIAAGAYVGACMNPAVATGLYGAASEATDSSDLWYFWVVPLLGSVLAYVVYRGLLPDKTANFWFPNSDVTTTLMAPLCAYLMEFLGTFTLAITVGLSLGRGLSPAMPVVMALFAMIYMGAGISGANYNPAVSIALLLRNFSMHQVLVTIGYIVSQVLGAMAGAALARAAFSSDTAYPSQGPTTSYDNGHVAMAEAVGVMVLSYTVLMVAATKSQNGNMFYGVAISLSLFAGINMVGRVSGGCLNPAVAFGLFLTNAPSEAISDSLGLYWAGPIVGSVWAVVAFFLTYTVKEGEDKDKKDDFIGTYYSTAPKSQ